MKICCPNPRCQSKETKNVLSYGKDDTLDNLSHYHLECIQCSRQFNYWDCDIEQLRKVFKENVGLYK